MKYDAFISYSQASDDKLAATLQNALQKFAKPWYKKRNLEIFRDETSLSASPKLWSNITKALDLSEHLILLASPLSENSNWVNKEIEYWLENKSIDNILIALTDGKIEWDKQNNNFLDPDNNSLPPVLDDKFDDEPFYIDLRQSNTEEDLFLDNPIFKKEILKLASKLHGKSPNDLASEEVRLHRKMLLVRNGAIVILGLLLIAAIMLGLNANYEKKKAQSMTLAAIANEQLDKNPTIAFRLIELAWKKSPSYPSLQIQQTAYKIFYESLESKKLFYVNLLENLDYSIVEFSPDGKKIITVTRDSISQIWDIESGKELYSVIDYNSNVISASFSHDGKKIVTAFKDGNAKLWDIDTRKELHTLVGHGNSINSVAFSHNSKKIVTTSLDNKAKIWDTESGKEIHTLKHEDINNAIFSPNGGKIITTDSRTRKVKIWDVQSGKELHLFNEYKHFILRSIFTLDFNNITFTSDEKKIITTHWSGKLLIWDAETGSGLKELKGHNGPVFSTLISPDGKMILTCSYDRTAKIWDVKSGKELHTLKGHKDWIKCARFSIDGTKIVTSSNDNTAKIWDVESGKEIHTLIGHEDTVERAVFSSDGKKIISISQDSTIKIWDMGFQKDIFLEQDLLEEYSSQFSHDERKTNKESKNELHNINLGVHDRSFLESPYYDGNKIIVTHSDTIKIWDVKLKKNFNILTDHKDDILSARFSPDGKKILTASKDSDVKIWDSKSGEKLLTFIGHSYYVLSAEFSPDGKRIVTTSDDGTVKTWDSETGKTLNTLKADKQPYEGAVFSPDGKIIVLLYSNKKIAKIWFTPEAIIDWLAENKNIHRLTQKDFKDLGIDFIDIK